MIKLVRWFGAPPNCEKEIAVVTGWLEEHVSKSEKVAVKSCQIHEKIILISVPALKKQHGIRFDQGMLRPDMQGLVRLNFGLITPCNAPQDETMKDRVVILTGATGQIGGEIALGMAFKASTLGYPSTHPPKPPPPKPTSK
jgi:hypothetical protein